jgi:tetratricopeptide (TPR) repeat protein
MGDYEQALAFYNKVLEMNPKNKNAYYLRGLLWLQVGMPEKGCEDLKKGEELGFEAAKNARLQYCRT